MATFDYNPITGNLDLVGSGASYINGVVADPTALPVTVGTPALDSVYLAKAGSGVWLINRRPSGLYCRVANNGNLNDWLALGAFPEVNSSTNWELYDGTDPTKELKFDLSGISTGTTRTLTVPNANGTIALTSGTTFTTLNANNGTITASAPVLDLEQTWNNAAVAFTGVRFNAVRTAASDSSALLSLTVAGNNRFSVIDTSTGSPRLSFSSSGFAWDIRTRTGGGVGCNFSGIVGVSSRLEFLTTSTSTVAGDVHLVRESADTLAMVRSANGQTFRLYNTQTDASNFERGFLRWSSNVLQIGTEAGGTGSARNLELQTGGTTRATIDTSGVLTMTGSVTVAAAGAFTFSGRGGLRALGQGTFRLLGSDGSSFGLLHLGVESASYPALKRVGTALQIRLGDDSAFTSLACGALTINGDLTVSTRNIVTDATTGTRIGTATTQLLGFWNAAPSAQPAAVADATDAATVITQLNALLSRLRTIGIIAT